MKKVLTAFFSHFAIILLFVIAAIMINFAPAEDLGYMITQLLLFVVGLLFLIHKTLMNINKDIIYLKCFDKKEEYEKYKAELEKEFAQKRN